MLQVEQAKKDVRRAEQKVTKVQSELQAYKTRLNELEGTLAQLQHAGKATGEANIHASDAAQAGRDASASTSHEQSAAGSELQTSSSLPAEGRNDLNTGAAAQTATTTTDSIELQPASPPPAEGRNDIALEDAAGASTSAETGNTPSENIPTEPAHETPGAQVHADITVDPAPTEEDLTITSGAGSMPILTHDEHAWPPPQIREELAESIVEDTKHDHTTTTPANKPDTTETNVNKQETAVEKDLTITSGEGTMPILTHDEHAWPPPQIREEIAESIAEEVKHDHGHTTTISSNEQHTAETNVNEQEASVEKDFTITSGEGTMPILTHDEHAWPPPQIREELAQSVIEEAKHEHADTANGHGEASTEEEPEHHETEHEGNPNRSRRAPRRRARNNDQQ
ncbi:MAG: hypothetical protein NVS2B12_20250 [Ktedonobacteraceae bacterium]